MLCPVNIQGQKDRYNPRLARVIQMARSHTMRVESPASWGYAITMESEKHKYEQRTVRYEQTRVKYEQMKVSQSQM